MRVTSARPLLRLIPTALLGAASTLAVLLAGFHFGIVLVVAGASFILLLPRHPRAATTAARGPDP